MLIRGCHAPVFVRQGKAEARHRAPTYRERWVKNDGSGTLGYSKRFAQSETLGLRFCICGREGFRIRLRRACA